ncbi:hypothetical protein JMN32_25265 [Fulvivirga sp. 29W222]|uniref:Uncharacterized protein n=1 Tax=Fulvivirga marina TaxID=2494733 RepID=A0A937KGP4_9BACT|nr:hypothetical protein [Fulvivirga marina]MBL6449645.1 hypothetical protein [Fulvivirga marina]
MSKKGIIAVAIIATFGALTMSCNEEEVIPSVKNTIEVATEGDDGHVEPPVEEGN